MAGPVSAKGQIAIPKRVREGIGVQPGDHVVHEPHDGVAILRKAESFDDDYHRALTATLSEGNSPNANEAFRDL